jgi:hypothetical protein
LIRITKLFLEKIEVELSKTADKALLMGHIRLVEWLANGLDWLDNAHSAQTPRGLVQFLEEIAETLYPGALLLVSPSSEYNYSIADLVPLYAALAKQTLPSSSAAALVSGLPKALYLVRFPRIERENVLNHSIFGHEFGHPIADEYIDQYEHEPAFAARVTEATQKIQADPQLNAALLSRSNPLEKSSLLSHFLDSVVKMHKRGLQELVSDAVGVHLFGPSAVFASLDIFGQSSLDSAPMNPSLYPPSRYRLRLTHKLLQDGKYLDTLAALPFPESLQQTKSSIAAILKYLDEVVSQNPDTAAIQSSPLARIAYEWLEETLPGALAHAQNRVLPLQYTAQVVGEEVVGLVERLALHVPPNEIGTWPTTKTVDWRSGLLASWLYALTHSLDSALPMKECLQSVQTIQKLAIKGIEYAVLQKQYQKHLTASAKS